MAPIAVARDDFTDNTISPMWTKTTTGSATGVETGGQAQFSLPSSTAGTHDARYTSTGRYDLTGDAASIDIGTMVATGVAATAYFRMHLDADNYYEWTQTSGTLKARKIVATVATDLYSVAWSASTYQYLRIRESGGTVFFDSSTTASAGGTWTNRGSTTIASAFAVAALQVVFGASCGNIASPGSFRINNFNAILPLTAGTWRETTADWQITNRLRPVTLACTANAQGVLVVADDMDSARVLSGNLRYFAGPLGSASGGYLALTEYASLVLAQGSPFPIPVSGRVDLPALVDARFIRLYHRSTDGAAHTLREYVPRRIVQADDIEAESISAINIAAHTITADQIATINLDALARITAAAGAITLDDQGLLFDSSGTPYILWVSGANETFRIITDDSSGTLYQTSMISSADRVRNGQITLSSRGVSANDDLFLSIVAATGASSITMDGGSGFVGVAIGKSTAPTAKLDVNGTLAAAGSAGVGVAVASNVRLFVKGQDATSSNYAILAQNSAATQEFHIRNDGEGFLNAVAWTYASDERLKEKIKVIDRGLTHLLKLKPKKFDYIDGAKEQMGFLAADVQSVMPELVVPIDVNDTGPNPLLGMLTTALIPVIVASLQEIDARIAALENKP